MQTPSVRFLPLRSPFLQVGTRRSGRSRSKRILHCRCTTSTFAHDSTARSRRRMCRSFSLHEQDGSWTCPRHFYSPAHHKHLRDHTPAATHAHQSPSPKSPLRQDVINVPPRKLVRVTHLIPRWSLPSIRPFGVADWSLTRAARRHLARNILRVHWVHSSLEL